MRTLLLLAFLTSSPILAAEADEAMSQDLYESGVRAYAEGRYQHALAAFAAAYDVAQVPGLLFNIGQCHRQLGNHEQAIEYYERYMKEEPDVPEIAALLAEERELLAKSPKKPVVKTPPPPRPAAVVVAAPPPPPSLLEEPVFWGVAGGAALVVIGGVIAVVAISAQPPTAAEGSLGNFDLRSAQ
ncbi:MAG: tetratricopeptide repeat protein [Deltaproteobacteria bacterium]|nr:tetratricopeptide repeat protein [Deltaproteobacteria bacterium]